MLGSLAGPRVPGGSWACSASVGVLVLFASDSLVLGKLSSPGTQRAPSTVQSPGFTGGLQGRVSCP